MKKFLIGSIVLNVILAMALYFGVRYVSKYSDVINLDKNRPELIQAVMKVEKEEAVKVKDAATRVKENSVKQILSPLVIDEEVK